MNLRDVESNPKIL